MVTGHEAGFLRLLAACLNGMYGLPGADRGRPSSLRALKRLQGILASSAILRGPREMSTLLNFFQLRGWAIRVKRSVWPM